MSPTAVAASPENGPCPSKQPPSLFRRGASLVYEILLLAALLLIVTLPFVAITGGAITPLSRLALQLYVFLVCGAYFVGFWLNGGQTLPMKTWHLRLQLVSGGPLTWKPALLRYGLAWLGLALFGLGFLWALVDRERCFLHDRLAGTRLVDIRKPKPQSGPAPDAPST